MTAASVLRRELTPLSFRTNRQGSQIVITGLLPQAVDGPRFEVTDLMERPTRARSARDYFAPVRDALAEMPEDAASGLCAVSFSMRAERPPVVFTVSILLADTVGGDALEPSGAQVTPFTLAGEAGHCLARLTPAPVGDGTVIPLFSQTYVAETAYGSLVLGFATAQIDAAVIFADIFDQIAASVTIT